MAVMVLLKSIKYLNTIFLLCSTYFLIGSCQVEENYLGCYADNANIPDLSLNINETVDTASKCLLICIKKYYRYAGIKNGSVCSCGEHFGKYGDADDCKVPCPGNPNSFCGGKHSNDMYDTGQLVPGPPANLSVPLAGETKLKIVWNHPVVKNGNISKYEVTVTCVKTYAQTGPGKFSTYLDKSVTNIDVPDLYPGSTYNVSVAAENEHGLGIETFVITSTLIGVPDIPEMPSVVERDKGQITIKISPAVNNNGPITAYQIVVINGDEMLQSEDLKSYHKAQSEGLGYYIAAELEPAALEKNKYLFVVGDGSSYGGYNNPPLPPGQDIHVSVGIVSKVGNVTKKSYAFASHQQHGATILNVSGDSDETNTVSQGLILGLSLAIGFFALLLFAAVIAYFFMKQRVKHHRRLHDNQEFSLHGPVIEVDPTPYYHNGFIPEEEELGDSQRKDYYSDLKKKILNISQNELLDMNTQLGQSQYGIVMSGKTYRNGRPEIVSILIVQDEDLPSNLKKMMLKDLDILIRVGQHDNIVSLVGLCEIPEKIFVVLQHYPETLKDILLKSRYTDHTAQWQKRISSLYEKQIFQIILGIASAMQYLAENRIVHRHLLARNVLMTEDYIPKVTGIGLSEYEKDGSLNYERWTAQEVLRGRNPVTKSDVWSFGILLWEICSLGATPYSEVPNNEVEKKIMRCHRLPQLNSIGDDLYQLMVQCWQLDLDERPSFPEISHILRDMYDMYNAHISFDATAGFHYEPYICDLEIKKL